MNQGGFNQDYYNRTDSAADSATPILLHGEYPITNAGTGWLTGYSYRKSFTVQGPSALSDYPVCLYIYRDTGTDGIEEINGAIYYGKIYIGTKCLTTYADIRITAADGVTELSYEIEEIGANYARIWFKDPAVTTSETTRYLYYGNTSATSASAGTAVWGFFDGFAGAALDTDKWALDNIDGTVTVASSIAQINAPATGAISIHGKTFFGFQSRIRMRVKFSEDSPTYADHCYAGLVDTDHKDHVYAARNENTYGPLFHLVKNHATAEDMAYRSDGVNYDRELNQIEGYHIIEIRLYTDSTNKIRIIYEGEQILGEPYLTVTNSSYVCDSDVAPKFYLYHDATWEVDPPGDDGPSSTGPQKIYLDWVKCGSFYNGDAGIITFGTEETPLPPYAVYTNELYLGFSTGSQDFVVGETVTGAASGSTAIVTETAVVTGSWAGGDAAGYIVLAIPSGNFTTNETITGGTAGSAKVTNELLEVRTYEYTAGTAFFVKGATVTGATTGSTGVVASFTFTGGDIGAGTAQGTVKLIRTTPPYFFNETATFTGGQATIHGESSQVSCPMLATRVSISKGVNDALWACNIDFAGIYIAPGDMVCMLSMPDHNGVNQFLFSGVVPDQNYELAEARNRSSVVGYSDAWYLSRQYLNRDYPMFVYNPEGSGTITLSPGIYMDTTLAEGKMSYINPRLFVTEMLDGTGIEVGSIEDSTPWADGTLPYNKFDALNPDSTKFEAIRTIGEYIDFYFTEWFTGGVNYAYFVSNDTLYSSLPVPSAVSFTNPDPYIIGAIKIEKRKGDVYNKIVVRGTPRYMADYLLLPNTNDITVSLSQTGTAETCSVIINGVDHTTFTENLSGGNVVSVSLTGISAAGPCYVFFVPSTKYYESVWEAAEVGDGTRIRQAPPYQSNDIKTQVQCDTVCNALVDFYTSDPNIYRVTFSKRTDLRLFQKVNFYGFPGVPETDMRITRIEYLQEGHVIYVSCDLVSEVRMTAESRLRHITQVDNVAFVKAIVDKMMKAYLEEEPVDVVVKSGLAVIAKNCYDIYRMGVIK